MSDSPAPHGDDVLARRALARLRARAWEAGEQRDPARRAPVDPQAPAPWDTRPARRGARDEDADRGPGLPPGRDRPGPTRYDPRTGAAELNRFVQRRGWAGMLAIAGVRVRWEEIVGSQIAAHATVESFEVGRLTLRADSSAWAQQLRLLMPTIEGAVHRALGPGGGKVEIRVLGPAGPTWRHGRVAVRGGRGPRDTYG